MEIWVISFIDGQVLPWAAISMFILFFFVNNKGKNTGVASKLPPVTYPDGTKSYNNPPGISENALREDFGLALRKYY